MFSRDRLEEIFITVVSTAIAFSMVLVVLVIDYGITVLVFELLWGLLECLNIKIRITYFGVFCIWVLIKVFQYRQVRNKK